MTSSHYNNIIQWSMSNISTGELNDSAQIAKNIFDRCGEAFPSGNCAAVLHILKSNDYVSWRKCTAEEAQQYANKGIPAVAISEECITIIRPEESTILVKSFVPGVLVSERFANTVSEIEPAENFGLEFFAAYATQKSSPIVYTKAEGDPCSFTKAQEEHNAKYIYEYLRGQGFLEAPACGVLGNIEQECHFNPGLWEVMNDTGMGYGLAQWSPATGFLNWLYQCGVLASPATGISVVNAMANENSKRLMDLELTFLVGNPDNRWLKPSGTMNHSKKRMTYAEYKVSPLDAYTLAMVFHDHYERSGDTLQEIKTNRCEPAARWYKYFVG